MKKYFFAPNIQRDGTFQTRAITENFKPVSVEVPEYLKDVYEIWKMNDPFCSPKANAIKKWIDFQTGWNTVWQLNIL